MFQWIKTNPSQSIGFFFAAVAAAIPVVGDIADDATPLGADPRVFVLIAAALLAVTIAGRVWQAVRGSWPVSWGVASVIGFASALVAALVGVLGELTDALAPFGIDASYWYSVSAGLAIVTKVLRYAQAVAPGAGTVVIAEPVPTEGGANEPEVVQG